MNAIRKAHSLDGLTILRFAHAFETGGGLEKYLDDLNQSLSDRNRLHTVLIHLTTDASDLSERSLPMGQGRLTRCPLPARKFIPPREEARRNPRIFSRRVLKEAIRDHVFYQPMVYRLITRRVLNRRPAPKGICDSGAAVASVTRAVNRHRPDMAILHSMGSADCREVIEALRREGVPVALINHFANDRFLHSAVREQVALAQKVGGVAARGLPPYLRNRFSHVADGVDVEFFRRVHARSVPTENPGPWVLLPARLVATKGHLDLVRAAGIARKEGVTLQLALAGPSDSPEYDALIRATGTRMGVSSQIHFVGQLNRVELRDWYAKSGAVALPSYHHEGLPRILLESQAMETPPVVYDAGGMADGLLHGRTGYLLKKGDVGALADALIGLARDGGIQQSLGRAGRAFVEKRFSLAALAERHEQFCLELVQSRNG
jgi:glycosyltransferase involved in cell wall biosynthesis